MGKKGGLWTLAGTAVGVGAGLAAQRSMVQRRRRNDPEAAERFGERRGERSSYVQTPDGATLFLEETGPPSTSGVVFIHGSVLRTDTWYYQLPGLGDHRLVFYDLRGHGLSHPKGDSDFTIQTLAEDLELVIQDRGLEEVVVVGHSVGGMIALQLCVQRSDLLGSTIKGLVLTNTTHRPAYETLLGGGAVARIERLARRPLDVIGSQHASVAALRKIIKPSNSLFMAVSLAAFGPDASARQIDYTYDMLAETPTDVIFDLFKAYRDFDVTDSLGQIDVPALVIGGTHDRLTVLQASKHLAEKMPNARLEIFSGCGHMTMLERHREFNALLGGFFDDVLGVRSSGREEVGT